MTRFLSTQCYLRRTRRSKVHNISPNFWISAEKAEKGSFPLSYYFRQWCNDEVMWEVRYGKVGRAAGPCWPWLTFALCLRHLANLLQTSWCVVEGWRFSGTMSGDWSHSLFGCFDNFGLCLVTYFIPCYTHGKVAELVGENCFLCGLASITPGLHLLAGTMTRNRVREQRNIEGSIVGDLLYVLCCPFCALIQEAQEVGFLDTPKGDPLLRA